MKKAVAESLVSALKFGSYRQATNTTTQLRVARNDKAYNYTVYGVLCNLYQKEVGGAWLTNGNFVDENGNFGIQGVAPQSVLDWAGLQETNLSISMTEAMHGGFLSFKDAAILVLNNYEIL